MSDPIEQVDRRFMDQLLALSKKPGSPVDFDVTEWMLTRGFARPQNLPTDAALGGLVITQAGLDWLKITKYPG
ncbi:hypothetical protein FAZ95_13995 [Trinickia violacea]|uniref:Uncharacterized protein n=1 Tax=Trinickia violacea TaxID=2571746 RepID=A0A4P8IT27_9BURK|nr:hypothetical protein [Trinickia violacea]QCP50194.1 hypothetical protein FAZ95_13995 [Trinickia violacea]